VTKQETRPTDKDAAAVRAPADGEALRVTFGVNFKAARIKAGLTQTDIAGLTGIAQTYISSIECGKQNPTLDTLAMLAEAIDSDVRSLLKPLHTPAARSRKRAPR
jgi:transcriptional regulator with XRE-family HTH domain